MSKNANYEEMRRKNIEQRNQLLKSILTEIKNDKEEINKLENQKPKKENQKPKKEKRDYKKKDYSAESEKYIYNTRSRIQKINNPNKSDDYDDDDDVNKSECDPDWNGKRSYKSSKTPKSTANRYKFSDGSPVLTYNTRSRTKKQDNNYYYGDDYDDDEDDSDWNVRQYRV